MKLRITVSVLVALLLAVTAAHAAEWTSLTPTWRCAAQMAFDNANQRTIMFGGTTVFFDGRYYNDVWEMRLDSMARCRWTRLAVSGTPPQKRDDIVIAYDPAAERMIIFGGSAGLGSRLSDLWALNLTPGSETWQQLTPSGTPPSARHFCSYLYRPGSLYVFGGEDSVGTLNDVWRLALDSLAWHQISPSGTPPSPRCQTGAAYDSAANRALIFGGYTGGGFTDEVWALDLTPGAEHWTKLSPGGNGPSARGGFAYAQGGDQLFVSCGWAGGDYYNDLYALDIPTLTWSHINPGGDVPLARRNPTGVWDDAFRRFIVFGGEWYRGYYLSDAYAVDGVDYLAAQEPPLPAAAPALSIAGIANGVVHIRCIAALTGPVTVKIADATGRLVRELYSGQALPAGAGLDWDGTDARGHSVPVGAYYCSVETGGTTLSRKFVLTR
jgi:hypothetical protein